MKNTTKVRSDREFLFGILWSAWWLHRAHGEDTYAIDLLRESVGNGGIATVQRLARENDYRFRRGFWTEARRSR